MEDGVVTFDEFVSVNDQLKNTPLHFDSNIVASLRRNPERLPGFILSPGDTRERIKKETEPLSPLQEQQEARAESAEERAEQAAARDQKRLQLERKRFDAAQRSTVIGNQIVDIRDPENPVVRATINPPLTEKDKFSRENTLRDEFIPIHESFRSAEAAFERISGAVERGTGPGDIALIFDFFKVLDPGGRVTEGEVDSARRLGSIPERWLLLAERTVEGDQISETTRRQILEEARGALDVARRQFNESRETYTRLAKDAGLNPNNVVIVPQSDTVEGFDPSKAESVAKNPDTGEVIYLFQGKWLKPDGTPVSIQ